MASNAEARRVRAPVGRRRRRGPTASPGVPGRGSGRRRGVRTGNGPSVGQRPPPPPPSPGAGCRGVVRRARPVRPARPVPGRRPKPGVATCPPGRPRRPSRPCGPGRPVPRAPARPPAAPAAAIPRDRPGAGRRPAGGCSFEGSGHAIFAPGGPSRCTRPRALSYDNKDHGRLAPQAARTRACSVWSPAPPARWSHPGLGRFANSIGPFLPDSRSPDDEGTAWR